MTKQIIKDKWIKLKDYIFVYRLKRFKRRADKLRVTTGSQQFVLIMNGKLTIVSKKWFKEQKHKGKFPKNITANTLKRIAYYYTN